MTNLIMVAAGLCLLFVWVHSTIIHSSASPEVRRQTKHDAAGRVAAVIRGA